MTKTQIRANAKNIYTAQLMSYFTSANEEVLQIKDSEFCFPIVLEDGEEAFVKISVAIPTGSRDGDAYDGYAEAQEYTMKKAEKAEKAKIAAEKKARKIERDAKARAEKE